MEVLLSPADADSGHQVSGLKFCPDKSGLGVSLWFALSQLKQNGKLAL